MLPIPNPRSVAAVALAAALLASGSALAQDKLRIGKSVPNSWAFSATDVGMQTGIFKQEGIELAISSFKGDAQMQAGLTAGAVDVALGSGPGLGFRAKGVPAIGVAAMYGAPSKPRGGGAREVADQDRRRPQGQAHRRHHRRLADRLAQPRAGAPAGLGPRRHAGDAARLGAGAARRHGARRSRCDGDRIGHRASSSRRSKKGRIVLDFGDIEKNFYTHVIFATDDMVEKRTDALRRFLRGWFKTIAFIRANKAETVKITSKAIDVRESIVNRIYDAQVDGFSGDGVVGPGGDRSDPQVAQGSRHPRLAAGCAHDLQRQVRAGEALT